MAMLLSQSQGLAARIIGHPRKAEIPAVLVPRDARLRLSTPVLRRHRGSVCRAEQGVAAPLKEEQDAVLNSLPDDIPKPVIKIDNQHDPFATVVTIEYGDRLGELLDTIAALKAMKLNIRRAKVKTKGSTKVNKFYITDATTAEKIMKSARLEEIRLSILNNLIKYHPESGQSLGWGAAAPQDDTNDILHPLGPHKIEKVKTHVEITPEDETGSFSIVHVKTRDRPGLLTDIVRTLKDLNVNVISAEVDTEGAVAQDDFIRLREKSPTERAYVVQEVDKRNIFCFPMECASKLRSAH
ncbi:g12901 [Coccomyxa viridis]|uniref:G12901 protein n=1 Tax=Coccomyxa viridis TaxID=1274662 RepID=A0ABP1GCJ8_9CHLO